MLMVTHVVMKKEDFVAISCLYPELDSRVPEGMAGTTEQGGEQPCFQQAAPFIQRAEILPSRMSHPARGSRQNEIVPCKVKNLHALFTPIMQLKLRTIVGGFLR
jgi:hypothetical protein